MMQSIPTTAQTLGVGSNPLDETGLCLLSLDGGGVRGLSSLRILKGLMTKLNDERREIGLPKAKPCEIFDLIGGTSTGGLIAIMLGRLEMDVDECITEYTRLLKTVFEKSSLPFNFKGKIKGRFDSKVLENAIKQTIEARDLNTSELLNDGKDRGCRVFVCATAYETKEIARLKSYKVADELDDHGATIWEAALATSAATSFFDPVKIGTRMYADGALGANNPIIEVWNEAMNIWSPESGELKPLIKCIVSIGTGDPGVTPINDGAMQFLSKTLVEIVTDSERTAEQFISQYRGLFSEGRYFRFNVQQGLQNVGLSEHKEEGAIRAATDRYLVSQEQKHRVYHRHIEARKDMPKLHLPLPFARNKNFVGRNSQLEQLSRKIQTEGQFQRIAIVGLGGVGKTQIALETTYRIKERSSDLLVFWVPANDSSAFEQAYLKIGQTLQIPSINDQKADVKQLVKDELSRESQKKWLMVVDNADDVKIFSKDDQNYSFHLDQYLPENSQGSIIFTTRTMGVAIDLVGDQAGDNVIAVEKMSIDDAKTLLKANLVMKDLMDDIEAPAELLDLLTCLPLAIAQAAAYINKNRIAISRYIALYKESEENMIDILSENFKAQARYESTKNPVAATWLISFNQIRHEDPLAAEYLAFMSCINQRDIPASILPVHQTLRMNKALGTLKAFSFITLRTTLHDGIDSYDVHRLVHLATRNWLKLDPKHGDQLTIWSGKTLDWLAEIFPKGNHENKEKWTLYLPHARYILASSYLPNGHDKEQWTLLYNVAWCLRSSGDYSAAEFFARRDLTLREAVLGPRDRDTLSSLNSLAIVLECQGKDTEAELVSRRALDGRKLVLGMEDPDTLTSVSHLALVLHSQGKYEEAEKMNRYALEGRERLGPLSADNLMSINNLANVLRSRAQYEEAEKLNRKALEGRQKVLGPLHPDTLTSIDDLASVLEFQGKHDKAELLIRQALEGRKQALGAQHPDTLTSKSKLASVLQHLGKFKAAGGMNLEVLQGRERVLGLQHPDTLTSASNLADVLYHQGYYEEAKELWQRSWECQKVTLGIHHPSTLRSASNLAGLYQTQCKWKEAEMMNQEVLARYRESHGPHHPYTLTSMSNFAELLQEQGKYEAAEDLHRQALKGREALGPEHPDTLASVSNLAGILTRQQKYKEADVMHGRALEGYEKTLGPYHVDTLTSVYHIANSLHIRKEYNDAIPLYERACAGYEKEIGVNHPTTRSCARHYAKLLAKLDEESHVTGKKDDSIAPTVWKSLSNHFVSQKSYTTPSIDWNID